MSGADDSKELSKECEELQTVTIAFAGDSGDGMQLTGNQFTVASATLGNDVNTFPDYPSEIRAPAGTLPGVSGFQLSFSSTAIHTPGDNLKVLVAMNPAALKVNLPNLEKGGIIIVNSDSFTDSLLEKATYEENPLENKDLDDYQPFAIPISTLTWEAVKDSGISKKDGRKCKNMFSLGIVYWLFNRPMNYSVDWVKEKFKKRPEIAKANVLAIQAGYSYALSTEMFPKNYQIAPAPLKKGKYRQITGNEAAAWACIAASVKSKTPLMLSSYPITPATDILHELAKYQHFGIKTFQCEDEIAAMCSAIGTAFGGTLAVTSTSGPGLDLKSEALGLAVMAELPIVIIDVQRGGPSTGLPTKTEQSDLLLAMYGRNGECPIPILAASTCGDCFDIVYEAFRLAVDYMTPVIVLTDGYLGNGAEPWKIPDVNALPAINPNFHYEKKDFSPYARDPETLRRIWAVPGTPGLEHRIGGLEKDFKTGNVSHDFLNHEKMTLVREQKVQGIARKLPPLTIRGARKGKVLVVGWGSTYGAIRSAVESLQSEGHSVSQIHLRYLFPFQENLGDILKQFEHVIVMELNRGQLCRLLRAEYLVDAISYSKMQGLSFKIIEIKERILKLLQDSD